ncbi:DUF6303 family protein [Streptomyces sp. XY332]|uniref:DUF6303 family protein n=1 Tax=Streptomyces sp. XY332 TaxID=1415561 RepID=UPI0003C9CF64|nr:DUF6303 family protein [Streptomyces sp. XY332]AGZ93751.1 hypothetical protein [Streptomyces sp. XY332]KOY56331.1 hypothetical protein ADK59_19535 [Streptomyces sp. XY332]
MTHSARLANSHFGEWEIYVVTDGPTLGWPACDFRRTQPIPTLAERTAALADLGYEAAAGAVWEWMEMDNGDTGDVALLAAFDVHPIREAS